jgi:uncharacterized protein YcsI (UPF0317 family)
VTLQQNAACKGSDNMEAGIQSSVTEIDMNDAASTTNRLAWLREVLPQCQPQEGSPANTFTNSEREQMRVAFLSEQAGSTKTLEEEKPKIPDPLDILGWHGAPVFSPSFVQTPRDFREKYIRTGEHTGPTNGCCPGYLQCNLVVLPAGPEAFEFLLFCQRNPASCPLLEVCDGPQSFVPLALAPTADLRTDVPQYAIYRHGELVETCTDVTHLWPEHAVAFLIGCSFSYDAALMQAGIPLRSVESGRNVPMYQTSLKCRSAGRFHGNMVVSMKPIPALSVSQHVAITSSYTHAHGGPVCIGRPDMLGIRDLACPDWGDPIDIQDTEVPVFHACGVTPQAVLMASRIPLAITHAAGHMFITDRPADMSR